MANNRGNERRDRADTAQRADEPRVQLISADDQVRELDGSNALATLNRSEIDTQIATAKRWPRSITKFKEDAMQLATLDEETAGSMFYALPRGGKNVEGPSVRLAEAVGSSWGNLRYGARTVDVDGRFVTGQGMAFDLEKNLACAIEVKRRITDRYGRLYNDDMITMTANAAMSIALRNAIFKVVPFALVKPIYLAARETSIGKALSMEQRRTRAFEWYAKLGAKVEDVLLVVGRKGREDITIEDLVTLQGLRTAITDGEISWSTVLREAKASAEGEGGGPGTAGTGTNAPGFTFPISDGERDELDRLAGALRWNKGEVDQLLGQKGSAAAAIEHMKDLESKQGQPDDQRRETESRGQGQGKPEAASGRAAAAETDGWQV